MPSGYEKSQTRVSEKRLRQHSLTYQSISSFQPFVKPGDFVTKVKQIDSQSDSISMSNFAGPGPSCLTIRSSVCIIFNLRTLYFQSLQSLPNWIQLHRSRTSAICTPFQWINNKNFFYSLLLGRFQLNLFYCGKGRQNFASNVTLYPCERSRQNHLGFIKAEATSKDYSVCQVNTFWP